MELGRVRVPMPIVSDYYTLALLANYIQPTPSTKKYKDIKNILNIPKRHINKNSQLAIFVNM